MKKTLEIAIILLMMIMTGIATTFGENIRVGVKAGDYVKYIASYSYLGSTAQEPVEIDIKKVNGSLVTGDFILKTITQITNTSFSYDVSTAEYSGAFLIWGFIIPANLTIGDRISYGNLTVEKIGDWNGRKAIIADTTSPYFTSIGQVYWDQITGILLQSTVTQQSGSDLSIVVSETNLWSEGFNSLLLAIIVVIIVTIVLVMLAILRRRKPTKVVQTQSARPNSALRLSSD